MASSKLFAINIPLHNKQHAWINFLDRANLCTTAVCYFRASHCCRTEDYRRFVAVADVADETAVDVFSVQVKAVVFAPVLAANGFVLRDPEHDSLKSQQ